MFLDRLKDGPACLTKGELGSVTYECPRPDIGVEAKRKVLLGHISTRYLQGCVGLTASPARDHERVGSGSRPE
jgi:hypothetical protein